MRDLADPVSDSSLAITDIRMRDPFVFESSPGEYVLFGTTDPNLWGGPGTGFDCYISSDLTTWTGPIAAFRPQADFWADTQFWAPEVHAHHGRFYLFATFATSDPAARVRGTAVLVADAPTGPYLPWSDGPVTPTEIPCLDGTLFVDEAAQPWIVYNRGAEGIPGGAPGIADGEMYALRLTDDLREPVGTPFLLFSASSAPWSRPLTLPDGVEPPPELNLAKDPLFTDGAFLIRTETGALLMLWSSYGTQGYAMGIARSASGLVTGPWVQRDRPVWAENGGHGMVLRTAGGTDYLTFHHPNETPDERAQLVEVTITDDDIRLLGEPEAPVRAARSGP